MPIDIKEKAQRELKKLGKKPLSSLTEYERRKLAILFEFVQGNLTKEEFENAKKELRKFRRA